ncbi:hypothetical protein BVY02_00840 [bacterium J17]|nr:hypothetical protein BVY02_00840 [bacterium J17]
MPSISDGLLASRAGIQSHGIAISVLADNIANANTTGYKASRPDFADLIAGSLGGGGASTAGSGSQVGSITQVFNQGTLEFTGRGLDVAIDGNGFFITQDVQGLGQRFYSRAGNFSVDPTGAVVDQNGYQLLGFPTGGTGGLELLNINNRAQETIDTNNVAISGNLDAGAAITAEPLLPGTTFADLNNAASFSTFVDVFDSLGAAHNITVFFFKTGANAWSASAYVDAGDVGLVAGDPFRLGTFAFTFNTDGTRATALPVAPANDLTFTPAWNNGSDIANPIGMDFTPFTQFSAASSISGLSQDGTGGGSVVSFSVGDDGTLFAQLDNGQAAPIGTIATASFANPEGLERKGGSVWAQGSESGEAIIGTPGTGFLGGLVAGALELSAADLASDFIKLISFQRGFQGSSRLVTNIDDLLNEIINLA